MTTPQTFKELAELKTLASELVEIGKMKEAQELASLVQEAEVVLRGPEVFRYKVFLK